MINILVPLDGSQLAERALPYAARIAGVVNGRLTLVRASWAYPFQYAESSDELPSDAVRVADEMADAAAKLRRVGATVETHLASGDPHQVIEDAAGSRHADLIVMSTHGRGGLGRWLHGSVAGEVLRRARWPVLLVPAGCDHRWPGPGADADRPLRLLVPLDGSDLSETVVAGAGALASTLGAEIVLVRVVAPTGRPTAVQIVSAPPAYGVAYQHDPEPELAHARHYLEDVAERLRGFAPVRSIRVELGAPAATIAAVAGEEGVDAIAMATHGRSGLSELLMGSTAAATLQRATVPLLLVRPAGERQPPIGRRSSESAGLVALYLTDPELDLIGRALAATPPGEGADDPRPLLARIERERRQPVAAARPA
jgi:nucleotide-binding universal stress UspA family protein